MVFKQHKVGVIIRVLLLVAVSVGIAYSLENTSWEFTPLLLGLLIIAQTIELIAFHNRWVKGIGHFFETLEQGDFSGSYEKLAAFRGYQTLGTALDRVNQKFKELQLNQEGQFQYLQTVFEHVKVALICFEAHTHSIALMNSAACQLLQIPYLPHLTPKGSLNDELIDVLTTLPTGKKKVIKIVQGDNMLHLSIQVTDFTLQNKALRLVSIQDIKSELEQKEVDSWQKLIRVLTHEIMNSATPISSLSRVMTQKMEDNGALRDFSQMHRQEVVNIYKSAQTIERRSQGLIKFVGAYKSLTKIAPPSFQTVEIVSLFQRVAMLHAHVLQEKGIKLKQRCRPLRLTVVADSDLLEQALINLIRNAIDALEQTPNAQIILSGQMNERGGVAIKIADNGAGMNWETQEQIFVPFYTTKQHGSGVGLSLVRQIMHLHKGQVRVHTRLGEGSIFILDF